MFNSINHECYEIGHITLFQVKYPLVIVVCFSLPWVSFSVCMLGWGRRKGSSFYNIAILYSTVLAEDQHPFLFLEEPRPSCSQWNVLFLTPGQPTALVTDIVKLLEVPSYLWHLQDLKQSHWLCFYNWLYDNPLYCEHTSAIVLCCLEDCCLVKKFTLFFYHAFAPKKMLVHMDR